IRNDYGPYLLDGVGKPTYTTLLTALSLFGLKEKTPALLGLIAHLTAVLLIGMIGFRLKDEETGFLATVLFSLSGLYFHPSRGGVPNVAATSFLLGGIYALLERRHFLSGFLVGAAYTCHYGLLSNVGLLALVVLLGRRPRESMTYLVGFFLLPV